MDDVKCDFSLCQWTEPKQTEIQDFDAVSSLENKKSAGFHLRLSTIWVSTSICDYLFLSLLAAGLKSGAVCCSPKR
jgi:hypothetical protein